MVERPHDGPLPHAHPVAHGRPPQPDGDTVPQPPSSRRLPLATREVVYGWICVALVVAAVVIGLLR
ncbi:hypothetical protein OOK41_31500 [Micromonospora sp. NBC_01655]|uniref:hypothetical protein n=1 Tax=Micromonospora sp. NBC_01655 TaxID=2975983 RepID=UPI00224E9141|nr:hypothetical protein [Micromonospora sp. NBC_01655]MCX4474787.1 hypothetical protein [Micromonospora sp. NBC_01655]